MKTFTLIFFLIILYSCESVKKVNHSDNTYFEGEIEYNIDYSDILINVYSDYLEENIGDKVVLTFKNGNQKKEYYSKSGKLLSVRFLDLKQKKLFSKSTNEDTVSWIDITKQDTKLTFEQIKDSTVMGYSVVGIKTVGSTIVNDETFYLSGQFYYAKKLRINPEWYKDYYEANFNEIIKIGKGITISQVSNTPYWITTLNATRVKRRKVKDSELKFDLTGYKLKEL